VGNVGAKTAGVLISKDAGVTWTAPVAIGDAGGCGPALFQRGDKSVACFMPPANGNQHRLWQSVSADGGQTWAKSVKTEIPCGGDAIDVIRLKSGNVLLAANPEPDGTRIRLSLWLSANEGERWIAFQDAERAIGVSADPALIEDRAGSVHMVYERPLGAVKHAAFNEPWVWEGNLVRGEFPLHNVLAPLDNSNDDPRCAYRRAPGSLPLQAGPVEEHVGTVVQGTEGQAIDAVSAVPALAWFKKDNTVPEGIAPKAWLPAPPEARERLKQLSQWCSGADSAQPRELKGCQVNAVAAAPDGVWVGTSRGLFHASAWGQPLERQADYGVNGPLATTITALALDTEGTLWVGTPVGISLRHKDGQWTCLRGKEGLPIEDVTDLEMAANGDIWIGTSMGAVLYRPQAPERKWFYREGPRYLPDGQVNDLAIAADGKSVYCATPKGLGRIELTATTLLEKAQAIEKRIDVRHRRMGMVSACMLEDPKDFTKHDISDNDNDGLWTAYHVAAMSLAYAVTGDEAARESAKKSMDGALLLQDVSGIPGVVARSALPAERAEKEGKGPKNSVKKQWRPSPDGKLYWLADTSNDEIDGHYMAFYAYWEHIAQFDAEERARIEQHVRTLTDAIIANGYQLYDWHGKRTYWGFWSPELINKDPEHYLENGLNSLQMLSFLKVAHHITGDEKYKRHYDNLIRDHGYLDNIQLEKKVFPDENNHSDNQLACVAWYPLLQLEWTPSVRQVLHKAARRHYRTLAADRSSFFNCVFATIDPHYVDLEGSLRNLEEIPTDRRLYGADNSRRADLVFDPKADRFGKRQLLYVLPADERIFDKWNSNPYLTVEKGNPNVEDDGSAYLLPYWMARYHGFIAEKAQ